MHILVIAWVYVVLMMSLTETSVTAGIMTFLLYGVVPLAIILYLTGGRRRRQKRALQKKPSNPSPSAVDDAPLMKVAALAEDSASGDREKNI